MKISYKWLQAFTGETHSAEELGKMLTGSGLEVEDISTWHSIPGGLEGIVIGEVLSAVPHPNADKLRVCQVNLGNNIIKQIVCGAPNVAAGQKVLVATVGSTVYPTQGEPFEIKKAKIRGEVSEGMICAEDELSLGNSHDGILVLPAHYEPGKAAKEYFEVFSDEVIEIGLTANRGDAASHYGVARDLRALGINLINHELPTLPFTKENPIEVKIEEHSGCNRYSAVLIEGVSIAASPAWLQSKLKAIGINPINNVVDATNYILHMWGQPLHAFDANAIEGKTVIVRKAREGEKLVTLDKADRSLKGHECVIADTEKVLALGGVFGGLESGIQENTRNIFIESAWFDAVTIRKGARAHGLHTDASFRFERGTDPHMTLPALYRVAELILQIAGGSIASACLDVYPNPVAPKQFWFDPKKSNDLIGKEIPDAEVKQILNGLEISITQELDGKWLLDVPHYRVDVERPADVTEEILRIYGLNKIEMGHEIKSAMTFSQAEAGRKVKERMCNWLSQQGFLELATNSLTKRSYFSEDELANAVSLLNPLSQDLEVMRPDFVFGLLEAMQYNSNRKNADLRFFEVGKTYHRNGDGSKLEHFAERKHLAVALYGRTSPEAWNQPKQEHSFFTLKGYLEGLLKHCGLTQIVSEIVALPNFELAAKLMVKKQQVGVFGKLSGKLAGAFDLEKPVWYADLDLDTLINLAAQQKFKLKPVSVFPAVRRDLALVLDEAVSYGQLEKIAVKTEPNLLKQVNVFDVYQGDKIEKGKKSYALSFVLQDEQKTLTDQDIETVMSKLVQNFGKEVGAQLRG